MEDKANGVDAGMGGERKEREKRKGEGEEGGITEAAALIS